MDLDQGGDWSGVYHLSVRLAELVSNVRHVEYFWSHVVDIEKAMPSAVILTKSGADGLYRIPLTTIRSRAGNWLIIGVSYIDDRADYGLITAKHFTDTYTSPKGHHVTRVSMSLARPPFAWVKPHVPSHVSVCQFTGDTVDGHRPESLVSRVYSTMDAQFRNMLFHVTAADKDVYIETLVRDTLSRLAAPLAFKVVYEQSRLTRELLRGDTGHVPVESDLWGTCVLWTLCDELTKLTLRAFTRHKVRPECAADCYDVQSAAGWLEVELTGEGLALSRRVTRTSDRVTLDLVDVPYWAVVLTAFCCGALDMWRRAMRKLSDELKIDSAKRRTHGRALCQRCGSYYRNAPIICPTEPARVLAVSQIDKILFGDLCTTLCARVFSARSHKHGDSPDQRDRGRCLNHKRAYSASFEEEWDDQQEQEHEDSNRPSSTAQHTRREPSSSIQAQAGGRCAASTPGPRYKDRREQYDQDAVSSYARRKAQSTTNEPDPGWWIWQKQCRDRRRGKTGGVHPRTRRLWDLYAGDWGTAEHSDGKSTSFRYWRDFSCRSMGHHVETLPFGHTGGPLTI